MGISHKYGLRTIAMIEAAKGLAVIVLCVVLLSLLKKDIFTVVDHVTLWLRLNPASRVADWFYDLADRATGRGIWTVVGAGLAYSTLRLVEAYGLWNQRHWAEWVAVISGGLYVPFEIYALYAHPGWKPLALLIGNLIVVVYIMLILAENRRERLDRARHGGGSSQ